MARKRKSFGSTKETHKNLSRGAAEGYRVAARQLHRHLKEFKCRYALEDLVWLAQRQTQMREHARHARTKPFRTTGKLAGSNSIERLTAKYFKTCGR